VTGAKRRERLDLVLPVHDEAAIIERVVDELFEVLSAWVDLRILACEDGSTDGTDRLLARMASRRPLEVIAGAPGRGYARAVCDGIRAAETVHVLHLDADGQCDPRDFPAFWQGREGVDVCRGFRTSRRDPPSRRLLSRTFRFAYDALLGLHVRDPSCPFVLARRDALASLVGRLGTMEVGFWWELVAHVHARGLRMRELPIQHRARLAGHSTAIPLRRVPRLAVTQSLGLLRLRRALRAP